MSYERVIEWGFRRVSEGVKATGFKIFYYHPLKEDGTEVWNLLTSMPDLHVLHLKRRNILRTLISRKIAGQTKVWFQTQAPADSPDRRIEFEVGELRKGFRGTRRLEAEGDRMFAGHPKLEVAYEDLTADILGTFARITEFLGVEALAPSTEYVRQNPEPMSKLVRNYAELKEAFKGTQWEDFFE